MSPRDPSEQGWQQLGEASVTDFAQARRQCHWAAQALAAVGYTHMERADDDSQSNLGWVDGMQLLAGRLVETEPACFFSLTPAALKLALHEPGGEPVEDLELDGQTLEQAREWCAQALARYQDTHPLPLQEPPYEMPDHDLGRDERFKFTPEGAFVELARGIHDANLVMLDLRAKSPLTSVPRCWPHHFDVGALISLEEDGDPQQGRSIGIGWTPGDEGSDAPYWYVNPYPSPEGDLPELGVGRWHREGWIGVELRHDDVLQAGDGAAQEKLVRHYLDHAVDACRSLLEG